MSHRRLVLACALTIVTALVAALAFMALAVASPTQPVAELDGWAHTVQPAVPGPVDWSGLQQAIKDRNDIAWFAWHRDHPPVEAAPAPIPRSTPKPAAVIVEPGDASAAVAKWFGDIFDQAWGVSGCESGHNPSAVSPGGGNWGLFQINTTWVDEFESVTGLPYYNGTLNADANAQFARWLYDQSGGWGPWSCAWAA